MAISTVADEKATYKKRLIGWIKGIVILVFIHYIIYIVINLNQNIVNTIAQTSGKKSNGQKTVNRISSNIIIFNINYYVA